MFQDHDKEELQRILFDINDGNLDASIETILAQQAEKKPEPEGSSLVEEAEEQPA